MKTRYSDGRWGVAAQPCSLRRQSLYRQPHRRICATASSQRCDRTPSSVVLRVRNNNFQPKMFKCCGYETTYVLSIDSPAPRLQRKARPPRWEMRRHSRSSPLYSGQCSASRLTFYFFGVLLSADDKAVDKRKQIELSRIFQKITLVRAGGRAFCVFATYHHYR